VLNENLRRESELLQGRDRENGTLQSENTMLKQRIEELRSDTGLVKDE
jgi:cell division protein FtsB